MSNELTVISETIQRTGESFVADFKRAVHPQSLAKQYSNDPPQHPIRLLD